MRTSFVVLVLSKFPSCLRLISCRTIEARLREYLPQVGMEEFRFSHRFPYFSHPFLSSKIVAIRRIAKCNPAASSQSCGLTSIHHNHNVPSWPLRLSLLSKQGSLSCLVCWFLSRLRRCNGKTRVPGKKGSRRKTSRGQAASRKHQKMCLGKKEKCALGSFRLVSVL